MKNTKESKVSIELGGTAIGPHKFYVGFLGMILYREGEDNPHFRHSYSAYAEDFGGYICLTGFDIKPETVFDYMQVCEHFARTVGQNMKRYGVTVYELETGSPDTGIIFDESIGLFAYWCTDGTKMDPIPDDGIELFKRTLEECLRE